MNRRHLYFNSVAKLCARSRGIYICPFSSQVDDNTSNTITVLVQNDAPRVMRSFVVGSLVHQGW